MHKVGPVDVEPLAAWHDADGGQLCVVGLDAQLVEPLALFCHGRGVCADQPAKVVQGKVARGVGREVGVEHLGAAEGEDYVAWFAGCAAEEVEVLYLGGKGQGGEGGGEADGHDLKVDELKS